MGESLPKQFLSLDGIPIIVRTLLVFDEIKEVDEIILVLPKAYFDYFKSLKVKMKKGVRLIEAGEDRQRSVYNGLEAIRSTDKSDIVLIHDGVRPFATVDIVEDGIKYTKEYGAAACGVTPKDTLKKRDSLGFSEETLLRDEYVLIHTPQCFYVEKIRKAHQLMEDEDRKFTDDTAIFEAVYGPVYLYESSYENIKITTKEDMDLAKSIIERQKGNNGE